MLGGYNGVSFLLASCISPTRPSCLVNSEKLQTHPFLFCSRSCRITMAEGVERDEQSLFRGHPAQPVVAGKYLHLQYQTYILGFLNECFFYVLERSAAGAAAVAWGLSKLVPSNARKSIIDIRSL